MVLCIAFSKDLKLMHLDINNVFLNGMLYEEVFMTQPHAFIDTNRLIA